MNQPDPYQLQRFIDAQKYDYEMALAELKNGKKDSHWIWYIFPQVAGLGFSSMAQEYAIRSRAEAAAYIAHEILGPRLCDCAAALLLHEDKDIRDIMGFPDDLKLKSSMTLFSIISPDISVFQHILHTFYTGELDAKTTSFLSGKN